MNSLTLIGLVLLAAGPATAQEKPEPPTPRRAPFVALRADVVVSRYQGEKKISSRPYSVTFHSGRQLSLRQGNEVPVAVATVDKESGPVTSFQYRNVGVNMELTAGVLEGGRYSVLIAVEDSSLLEDRNVAVPPQKPLNVPVFQTRNIRGNALMRDGESASFSMSDPVTGDVTKVDVTLHVQK